MNYVNRKKTVRIKLMDDLALAEYDSIINSVGIHILREMHVQEKVTEHDGDGNSTTTITPYIVVTYLEKELV